MPRLSAPPRCRYTRPSVDDNIISVSMFISSFLPDDSAAMCYLAVRLLRSGEPAWSRLGGFSLHRRLQQSGYRKHNGPLLGRYSPCKQLRERPNFDIVHVYICIYVSRIFRVPRAVAHENNDSHKNKHHDVPNLAPVSRERKKKCIHQNFS